MSEDIISNLSPEQREVLICQSGPALVLAGAGSGKTTVITHKYAFLYKDKSKKGKAKSSILAITFTEKAARQMQERICEIISEDITDSWIGTLHRQCLRILRQEYKHIVLNEDFVIYDRDDQARLIRNILNDMKEYEALYKGILSKINYFKSSFISPDEKIDSEGNFALDEKLKKIYNRYKDELNRSKALDLDDLIIYTIKLFTEHPDVLKKYQNMFSYILVDEFQETNYAQYYLIKLLVNTKKCILVAGDDDQSVYKFKNGQNGANFLVRFETDFPKTNIIRLEQSYRSTQNIVNTTNSVISKTSLRVDKKLWSDRGDGEKVSHHWFDGELDEAKYIAKTMKDLYLKGSYSYGDMAVLYRVTLQSRILEDALKNERIPFKVLGSSSFYHQKEIKDIISYLRLISNVNDNLSLRRIINCPQRGIGVTTINKLENLARKEEYSFYSAICNMTKVKGLSAPAKEKLTTFRILIENLVKLKKLNVQNVIKEVVERTNYLDTMDEKRIENVTELMLMHGKLTINKFLDHIALATSNDDSVSKDYVTLTTLDNVKGYEFSVVFIAGLEDGLLPYFKAEKAQELDDERRLFYVGMTRAKDLLYMTGAGRRRLYSKFQQQEPSRFLKEIPKESCVIVEKRAVQHNNAAANAKKEPEPEKEYPYNPGCRVKHSKWGIGVIRDCYGEDNDIKVTVNFSTVGIKRLALKYANLEKI